MSQARLNDVMIMRPIIVILLIVMHSFTMFTGGSWALPQGIHEVSIYKEISHITYSCLLESFVFISGYIFGMQSSLYKTPFVPFTLKKIHRLLLPSIIFSIIYWFCFYYTGGEEKVNLLLLYDIVNGIGHLWYLPMLFNCFLIAYGLNRLRIHDNIKFMLCLGISLFSGVFSFLPFRIGNSFYYLLFFYLGMYTFSNKEQLTKNLTINKVIVLLVMYIITYCIFTKSKDWITIINLESFYNKFIHIIALKLFTIIYSSFGLLTLYCGINYFLKNKNWECPQWLVCLNNISFGIYLYQQFILKIIYYYTPLPQWIGTYALPWVGCILTIIVSTMLTVLTIKTKIGRFLIG